jgi:hypothetical protein
MRDSKWYAGLAFGLVVGLAIAALVSTWLSDGLPGWWRHDGAVVTSTDTLANWLVAIFSFIAALFLWLTLRATQEMAIETRRIGEAQVRAYISITKISLAVDPTKSRPTVEIGVRNTGQSPARRIEIVAEFSFFADAQNTGPFLPSRQIGVLWLNDIPSTQEAASGPTQLADVVLEKQTLGDDLSALISIHLDIVVYAYDAFDQEILAFGHYATGWTAGEDKSVLKPMHDFSHVARAGYMVDKLRRAGRPRTAA